MLSHYRLATPKNTIHLMIKCTKCTSADAVMGAGFIRGRQRFFCKTCGYHFTDNKALLGPERKRHQTTISDVAKVLGVAPSTVSRALNDHSDINSNTQQAIIDVVRQLDYQPNLLAQSLRAAKPKPLAS